MTTYWTIQTAIRTPTEHRIAAATAQVRLHAAETETERVIRRLREASDSLATRLAHR